MKFLKYLTLSAIATAFASTAAFADDEEKKKLDDAFAANLKVVKTKLANEKSLEGHVFKARSYLIDSIN